MIDFERWDEIKPLVQHALDLPEGEREAYLDEACQGDQELRRQAGILLAVSVTQADAYDNFVVMPPGVHVVDFKAGDKIGPYRIVRPLGTGGMSTVYLADDPRNGRQVALKVLRKPRRRRHEERTVARFNHPNIVTFHDSGQIEGGPAYFVMEYIDGEPITTYCETKGLSIKERLRLFLSVCDAVAYAHRHLVVHRDLKPANILVNNEGKPKLLDFGIAKSVSPSPAEVTVTAPEDRALTVAFASPEQLTGESTSTATDIYSLGVLLCLLLTGRLPYAVKSYHDLPWAIRNMEPEKPSRLVQASPLSNRDGESPTPGRDKASSSRKLARMLAGDLDAIILRALRKEADKRYRTAEELAEDINNYLNDAPVAARKGGMKYTLWKFVKRHSVAVPVGAVVMLAFIALLIGLYYQWSLASRQRDLARREAQHAAGVSRFLIDMFSVPEPWTLSGGDIPIRDILDRASMKLSNSPPRNALERGTILHALGTINLHLGMFTPAETLIVPALHEIETTQKDDRALIADIQLTLARLQYYHGRYGEAEHSATRALQLGAASGTTQAYSLSMLGHCAFSRGDFRGAERYFRQAHSRFERVPSGRSIVPGALNDLGCALFAQGRLANAREVLTQSVSLGESALGNNHIDVVRSHINLARVKEAEGNVRGAEAIVQRYLRYSEQLNLYDPLTSLIRCNLGSLLLSEGRLVEGEDRLTDCFGQRRVVLPDTHPDIARTIAELGRAAHSRERYSEAETYYRESLLRIEKALGPHHPDRVPILNNLAVLLTEEGRHKEATVIWQELGGASSASNMGEHLQSALRHNASLFGQDGRQMKPVHHRIPGYRLLPLLLAGLSEPRWTETRPPQRQRAPISRAKIIFADDFDDGLIDRDKWEYGGNSVIESKGRLDVGTTITDAGGWARTRPLVFDPRRHLILTRRAKIHPANRIFDGTMIFDFVGYPANRFMVSYANYHHTSLGDAVTVGFSIARRNSNSHMFRDRALNATPLISPLWDRWFDEKIVYDPMTGYVEYFIDGARRLEYNVGPAPPHASVITVSFSTWGWYTGHVQSMEHISLMQ